MIKQFTLLCVLVFTVTLSSATGDDSGNLENHKVNTVLKRADFSGAILVQHKGQPIHRQGYGMAVKEWTVKNTASTRFRIASLSKTFTAVLVMQLVEDGKINLDASLESYLPSYPAAYAKQVTIKHLLTHRTGISRYFKIKGWRQGKALTPIAHEEFTALIASMPLEFTPGTKRHYSNANYYLLGTIIEKITGKSYEEILEEKILTPLGMTNTDVYRAGHIVPKLANAYKHVKGQYSFCPPVTGQYCKATPLNLSVHRGSSSLHSTIDDLIKWDHAMAQGTLLSRKSKEILLNLKMPTAWTVATVQLSQDNFSRVILASGSLEGYASLLIRFPDKNLTIILLNNSGMTDENLVNISLQIAAIVTE